MRRRQGIGEISLLVGTRADADRTTLSALREQTFYYSTPGVELSSTFLGRRHYSYRFVVDKFLKALESSAQFCQELRMPEYYGSLAALPRRPARAGALSRRPL